MLCVKIFNLSSENGKKSKSSSNSLTKKVIVLFNKDIGAEELEKIDHVVRKVAHLSIYGLLGLLVMGCMETFEKTDIIRITSSSIFTFLYACSDEIHQKYVPGRSGEVRDVFIDFLGAFLGILIIFLICKIVRTVSEKREEKNKKLVDNKTDNDKKRKILFIASTGGHLSELMQLKPMFKKYDYHIITEKTEVDESLKEEYGTKMSFLIYGTKKHLLRYLIKFTANWLISLYYFFKYQPEIIITTGTHTAVPMCYIAKIFGSKVIFIETFANRTTATVSGRLVYPIADVFVVQWEEMHEIYPKSVCWGWIY